MNLFFGNFADLVIVFGFLFWVIYYYSTSTYGYWKRRKIPYMQPAPLFGNSMFSVRGVKHSSSDQQEAYNTFKKEKYFGRFNFRTPVLVIRDPEIVEMVLIKDFAHFCNRGFRIDPKLDKLSLHLVNLRDQQWKYLRNRLTPVFSSAKLKSMHQTLIDCSESLNEVLEAFVISGEPLNARAVMASFTTEVIGHCAFGLKMNALKNPNSEFRRMGKMIFKPTRLARIRFMIRLIFPKLLSLLKWKAMPKKTENFFIGVIKEAIAVRESSHVEVKDFLQLLINLRKEDRRNSIAKEKGIQGKVSSNDELPMDDTLLTSNAMIFFLAGFETTASTLSFCLFEMAQNPEIQEKLREEVVGVVAEYSGVPTFEAVRNMPYLDQVISETLRKYPPASAVPRECTKDWIIPETDIVITKGTMVQLPTYSLHHDPEYYPEPHRFLPERFDEHNKRNLRKGTYLPFGDGPRICIGKRFAELEMKVALSSMLLKYRFSANSKTQLPIKFHPRSIFLNPIGGLWINISKLSH